MGRVMKGYLRKYIIAVQDIYIFFNKNESGGL